MLPAENTTHSKLLSKGELGATSISLLRPIVRKPSAAVSAGGGASTCKPQLTFWEWMGTISGLHNASHMRRLWR